MEVLMKTVNIFERTFLNGTSIIQRDCFSGKAINFAVDEGLILKTVDNSTVFYRLPTYSPEESSNPDWYCYECHIAGDVVLCATNGCNRVFHENCVKTDEAKQKSWDKLNYHKNKFKSKSQAMQNCLKRSASESSDNSGSAHPYFNSEANSDVDEITKFCYACRLEKKGIITSKNSNKSIEEVNYLLKFAFDRVSTWVMLKF